MVSILDSFWRVHSVASDTEVIHSLKIATGAPWMRLKWSHTSLHHWLLLKRDMYLLYDRKDIHWLVEHFIFNSPFCEISNLHILYLQDWVQTIKSDLYRAPSEAGMEQHPCQCFTVAASKASCLGCYWCPTWVCHYVTGQSLLHRDLLMISYASLLLFLLFMVSYKRRILFANN